MKTKILILFLALAPVMTQAQVNYAVSGNTAYVTNSPNASGNVVIANTYDGYPVTSIETYAFENCTGLTGVTIGTSVTTIGDGAFDYCSGLTSVTIPNSVTSIGDQAFFECYSLANVTIPNSVTSIGDEAFSETSLASVTIPNGVTSIGEGTFEDCVGLKSVTIPDSVTSIGGGAFAECSGLTSVTIPSSISSIGDYVFEDCGSLRSAYFLGNAPPDDGTAFSGDPATVYYLMGATGWGSTFGGVPAALWNPQATAMSVTGGQFGFILSGPAKTVIVVEACTNLSHTVWLPVSTNTLSFLGRSAFSDPQSGGCPMRYYRFRSP